MHRNLLLIFSLLLALQLPAFPKWPKQTATAVYQLPWFVAPQVKAGYTFGAGFHWGCSIDLGLEQLSLGSMPLRYGYSFGRTHTSAHKGRYTHKMTTQALLLETNYGGMRMGITKIRNSKGKKKNCSTRGLSTEGYVFLPSQIHPVIGFQRVTYRPSSWAWFDGPYNTVYGGVRSISYLHPQLQTPAPLFPGM
jgi:hypothetical protein